MIFNHGLKQKLRIQYQGRGVIILSACQMANLEKTKRLYFVIVPAVIISLLIWHRQRGDFKPFDGNGGWFMFALFLGWWLLLTVAHSYQHGHAGDPMGKLKAYLFMAGRLGFAMIVSVAYFFFNAIYDGKIRL